MLKINKKTKSVVYETAVDSIKNTYNWLGGLFGGGIVFLFFWMGFQIEVFNSIFIGLCVFFVTFIIVFVKNLVYSFDYVIQAIDSRSYRILATLRHYSTVTKIDPLKFRVLLIDDENHDSIISTLNKRGYMMTYKEDVDDVKIVENFDIIIVDIRGVGKSFDSNLEGAYVIKQIKMTFPLKYVYYYTGNFNKKQVNEVFVSDGAIRKSKNTVEYIEDAVIKAANTLGCPYKLYNRYNSILKKKAVSEMIIQDIEVEYEDRIINKRSVSILSAIENKYTLNEEIKLIISDLDRLVKKIILNNNYNSY